MHGPRPQYATTIDTCAHLRWHNPSKTEKERDSAHFESAMHTSSAFFPQQPTAYRAENAAFHHSKTYLLEQPTSSPRTPNGTGHLTSQQQGRGLRFPSSRRFLWDRTPAGAQVLINVEDHLPGVQTAASVFSAITRAAEQQKHDLALQLTLSVTPTNQVAALVQELDPLGAQTSTDWLRLTCPLNSDAHEGSTLDRLQGVFAAQLDQRDTARVQQLYAISATAAAEGTPVEHCSLQLQLLMPHCSLLATPLYTKRLCNVPLAEALLKPGKLQTPQTGYLSMDQARSLLPLEATDVNVYSTPLVGVWVKGPSSVMHPLVAAACVRFVYSTLLADRAVNPENGAFLLLLCPEGDPVSKCYEVCPTDPQQLQLATYQLEASINPSAGLAQFSKGGYIAADWVLGRQQPQPLPGQLKAAGPGGVAIPVTHSNASRLAAIGTGRSVATAAGHSAMALALSAPGSAMAADSPVVLGRAGVGNKVGSASYARSSAPMIGSGSSKLQQQQQYAAAAARRSLPLAVTSLEQVGADTESGPTAAGYTGTSSAGIGSRAAEHGSDNREGSSSAEPEPRASFSARPYGSPPLRSWTAARQRPATATQQHTHQEGQQQWVQLGEQLLLEPSADACKQHLQISEFTQQVAAAADDAAGEQRSPQTGSAAAAAAAAASPQLRIRTGQHPAGHVEQQQRTSHHAAETGPTAEIVQQGAVELSSEANFTVHQVNPVSPSVRAGVALSNLALLQHLSTGQLEQAIDKVTSPSKSRTSSPAKAATVAAARQAVGIAAATECAATGWSSAGYVSSSNSQEPASSAVVGPGTDVTAWSGLVKPQTPDTEGGSVLGGSVLMGSPRFGPSAHYVPPSSSVDVRRAAAASCPSRRSVESANCAAAGANAAAALRAATAAVHRLSPGPYPRSMGVQRYAADAAMIASHEYGQGGRPGWAAAGGLPSSTALVTAGHQTDIRSSVDDHLGNYTGTEQLEDALCRSLTAAVSSAAALEAAGQMHPYNAPDAGVCYQQVMLQQQQLQLLPTVWHDPVAQALQGEVQRLREELMQLRYQLKAAGMPRPEALALPPLDEPPVGPLPALPAPVTQSKRDEQQQQEQLASGQQQAPTAVSCLADMNAAGGNAVSGETQQAALPAASPAEMAAQHADDSRLCHDSTVCSEETAAADREAAAKAAQAAVSVAAAVSPAGASVILGHAADAAAAEVHGGCADAAVTCLQEQEQQSLVHTEDPEPALTVYTTSQQGRQQQDQQQQQDHTAAVWQILVPAATESPQLHEQTRSPAVSSSCTKDDQGCSSCTDAPETAGSFYRNKHADAAAAAAVPAAAPGSSSPPGSPRADTSPNKLAGNTSAGMGSRALTQTAAIVVKSSGVLRDSTGSSLRGSHRFGGVRSSLEVPPLAEVVRTKYFALDDDSDDSDREFEERLMLKYGMKH